jgi:hypothetical protein
MSRRLFTLLALLITMFLTGFCGSSRADSFNFDFVTGTLQTIASGTITTSGPFVGGVATVTAITGMFEGFAITGLLPNNTEGFSTDNLLYSTTPYLDLGGIIFGTANDSTVANLYFNNGTDLAFSCTETIYLAGECYEGSPYTPDIAGTFQITRAPEPGTLTLLGAGLLCVVLLCRKRFLNFA